MSKIKVLDKGWIELIEVFGSDQKIADTARKSTMTEGPHAELVDKLMEWGHLSPFEQAGVTFDVYCPIFVARQWMRHRTWSYLERSMRYSTPEDLDFYTPDKWRGSKIYSTRAALIAYEPAVKHAIQIYRALLKDGIVPELARMVLPVSIYTEFRATVDLRNLMHFLRLRLSTKAQWEIRQYAYAILIHVLFDNFPLTGEAFMGRQLRAGEYGWVWDAKTNLG